MGGAYGAGCSQENGVFSFMSFADPRCLETVEEFTFASRWAARRKFTQQDLDEAKLKYFASV